MSFIQLTILSLMIYLRGYKLSLGSFIIGYMVVYVQNYGMLGKRGEVYE